MPFPTSVVPQRGFRALLARARGLEPPVAEGEVRWKVTPEEVERWWPGHADRSRFEFGIGVLRATTFCWVFGALFFVAIERLGVEIVPRGYIVFFASVPFAYLLALGSLFRFPSKPIEFAVSPSGIGMGSATFAWSDIVGVVRPETQRRGAPDLLWLLPRKGYSLGPILVPEGVDFDRFLATARSSTTIAFVEDRPRSVISISPWVAYACLASMLPLALVESLAVIPLYRAGVPLALIVYGVPFLLGPGAVLFLPPLRTGFLRHRPAQLFWLFHLNLVYAIAFQGVTMARLFQVIAPI